MTYLVINRGRGAARQIRSAGRRRCGCAYVRKDEDAHPYVCMYPRTSGSRPGIALFTVLIVLVILGLMAGGFVMNMQAENVSQRIYEQQVQARAACDAGQTVALAMVRKNRLDPSKWFDNETLFRDIPLTAVSTGNAGQLQLEDLKIGDKAKADLTGPPVWRYSIVRSDLASTNSTTPIFGVGDEAAKFNLNIFNAKQADQYKLALMSLPNVTEEMADSLMDWLDKNANPRPNGAGDAYYASLNPPYAPAHGPLHSIDELLMVKGWTPKVLYGNDVNQNGLLDPAETKIGAADSLTQSSMNMGGSGGFDRGLAPFLTIWSVEANLANDNSPRLPLATPPGLAKLKELFGDEKAAYLTKLAQLGVQFRSPADLLGGTGLVRRQANSASSSGTRGTGSASSSSGGTRTQQQSGQQGSNGTSAGASDQSQSTGQTKDKAAEDKAESTSSSSGRTGNTGTGSAGTGTDQTGTTGTGSSGSGRTGTSGTGKAGAGSGTGTGTGSGSGSSGQAAAIPASPFTLADLPVLMDKFTTVLQPQQVGLINVNSAPVEVLMTVPGMDASTAQAIVSTRKNLSGEDSATTAWLLTNGIIPSIEAFQKMAPYITARASVFSIESVGYSYQSNVQFRRRTVLQMQGAIMKQFYVQEYTGRPAYDFVGLAQNSGSLSK